MTGEDRCECCDLPLYSCGLMAEIKERQEVKREAEWQVDQAGRKAGEFEAKYPGRCECGQWFPAGVLLVMGDRTWQSKECCG